MKKIDIEKLRYNASDIKEILDKCSNVLGKDFELKVHKDGLAGKVRKTGKETDIILTALYATYLLLVIDHYDELTKIGKSMIDNQFESFGEMLKWSMNTILSLK